MPSLILDFTIFYLELYPLICGETKVLFVQIICNLLNNVINCSTRVQFEFG